ncbi:hypothetical protein RRG08_051945 [Elysia crispata]|uniref:Uncharacterized protein n=1 Tax=Elysia crispata TaxID=231223 RepID=A0AAE1CRC6_9GAST|nr:hypothetical protein RRG08_051945 [Elysia crispata]
MTDSMMILLHTLMIGQSQLTNGMNLPSRGRHDHQDIKGGGGVVARVRVTIGILGGGGSQGQSDHRDIRGRG